MSETLLRASLERHLDDVDVPPGDVLSAITAGSRRRRRRTAVVAAGTALVLGSVAGVGVTSLSGDESTVVPDKAEYASLGPLDFSQGARAYADPGGEIHLGGRTFPAKDLDYLDTDAVATSFGVVFFDEGRPMLLGADGNVVALVDGDLDPPGDFHPTAKADSVNPWVAWATRSGRVTTLTVYDLESRAVVSSAEAPCGEECSDLVIDAFDDGVAYVRMGEETQVWDRDNGWRLFAGRGSRVADVRGGIVLYDGKSPQSTRPGDDFVGNEVPGAIDAQLTHDGRYVLSWSSTLQPVLTRQAPLVLEQGSPKGGYGFWTIDTDGSVLVADPDGDAFTVWDCEVPSGVCEELGPLDPTGGDPIFIGNDM